MAGLIFKIELKEDEASKVLLKHVMDKGLVGIEEAKCFSGLARVAGGRYLLEFTTQVENKEQ